MILVTSFWSTPSAQMLATCLKHRFSAGLGQGRNLGFIRLAPMGLGTAHFNLVWTFSRQDLRREPVVQLILSSITLGSTRPHQGKLCEPLGRLVATFLYH